MDWISHCSKERRSYKERDAQLLNLTWILVSMILTITIDLLHFPEKYCFKAHIHVLNMATKSQNKAHDKHFTRRPPLLCHGKDWTCMHWKELTHTHNWSYEGIQWRLHTYIPNDWSPEMMQDLVNPYSKIPRFSLPRPWSRSCIFNGWGIQT